MKITSKRKFIFRLRRYFISGLLVWVPIWVTVIVIKFIVHILDQTILFLPSNYRIPGTGVIITLAIILLTGFFAANFFGKQLVKFWDQFISHIPLVRTIHISVKKILQTIMTADGPAFRKVVLIEFPKTGTWTIAFLTGKGTPEIDLKFDQEQLLSVFVPTTPNITSGFLMLVPERKVIELEMTIEQALKYVVSLGVMLPPAEGV